MFLFAYSVGKQTNRPSEFMSLSESWARCVLLPWDRIGPLESSYVRQLCRQLDKSKGRSLGAGDVEEMGRRWEISEKQTAPASCLDVAGIVYWNIELIPQIWMKLRGSTCRQFIGFILYNPFEKPFQLISYFFFFSFFGSWLARGVPGQIGREGERERESDENRTWSRIGSIQAAIIMLALHCLNFTTIYCVMHSLRDSFDSFANITFAQSSVQFTRFGLRPCACLESIKMLGKRFSLSQIGQAPAPLAVPIKIVSVLPNRIPLSQSPLPISFRCGLMIVALMIFEKR